MNKRKDETKHWETRIAKRNSEIVVQRRLVSLWFENPWYKPFSLDCKREYGSWEDVRIPDADEE